MPVQCTFYRPGRSQFCDALRAMGRGRFTLAARMRLNQTYCSHGRFILCPIYRDVERALEECNRRREVAGRELRAASVAGVKAQ